MMGANASLVALSMVSVGVGYLWCYLVFLRRQYEVEKRLYDYSGRLMAVQDELIKTNIKLMEANDALARAASIGTRQ